MWFPTKITPKRFPCLETKNCSVCHKRTWARFSSFTCIAGMWLTFCVSKLLVGWSFSFSAPMARSLCISNRKCPHIRQFHAPFFLYLPASDSYDMLWRKWVLQCQKLLPCTSSAWKCVSQQTCQPALLENVAGGEAPAGAMLAEIEQCFKEWGFAVFTMSHYMRNSSATQERTICRKGCHAASFSQVAGRVFWRLRGSFLVHGCPHALYFAGVLYVYSGALPSAEYTAQSV